jgi:hypothetical protein
MKGGGELLLGHVVERDLVHSQDRARHPPRVARDSQALTLGMLVVVGPAAGQAARRAVEVESVGLRVHRLARL